MSQVREAFQVELPLNQLLNVPTVEGLAQSIEASQRGEETIDTPNSFIPIKILGASFSFGQPPNRVLESDGGMDLCLWLPS